MMASLLSSTRMNSVRADRDSSDSENDGSASSHCAKFPERSEKIGVELYCISPLICPSGPLPSYPTSAAASSCPFHRIQILIPVSAKHLLNRKISMTPGNSL